MGTHRTLTRAASLLLFLLLLLGSRSARSNPVFWSDPRLISSLVVLGIVWLVIVLIEGATIKLVLLGVHGASWPRAFLLALVLNAASAVVGGLAGIRFDIGNFEFEPSPLAVFGISLGVEAALLGVVSLPRRFVRALITAVSMNAASYLLLLAARFPGGARILEWF